MFLINFQLWARNRKIPGGGSFNIRGGLIIVGSDYYKGSLTVLQSLHIPLNLYSKP